MLVIIAVVLSIIACVYVIIKRRKRRAYNLHKSDLSKKKYLNVVITGASKGLGYAITKKLLSRGDKVVICSRSKQSVDEAVGELSKMAPNRIFGTTCDISSEKSLIELASFAKQSLGDIDLWVNNAGTTGSVRATIEDINAETVREVVDTNMIGTILNAKIAIKTLKSQKEGGHLYTYFEGAGSNGWATPFMACYGTTKYGLAQFNKSLVEECKDSHVGIHRLSPGMIMTSMLHNSANGNLKSYKVFNILAEEASVVADFIVENLHKTSGTDGYFQFLTIPGAAFRFITAFMRKNKFYDEKGNLKIKLA
ncbi:chlorophyll(ide) b reductase [Acrasis kona]|uniref:Chlorophyll(Ide) b reductase n=1 Tax=Acrasis kona TaxID=1008807 RepID=A0AAW2ZBF7_9EUKA